MIASAAMYLTPPQVSERLGIRVGSVLAWIASGELAASNVAADPRGRRPRWRISEDDLAEFLARRRATPKQARTPHRPRRQPTVKQFFS